MAGAKFSISAMVMVSFIDNDDLNAVSCEMFIFERGDDDVTASAYCRTEEALLGRAAYLDVEESGPLRGNESAMSRCEDAALFAASLVFSCTVDVTEVAPKRRHHRFSTVPILGLFQRFSKGGGNSPCACLCPSGRLRPDTGRPLHRPNGAPVRRKSVDFRADPVAPR